MNRWIRYFWPRRKMHRVPKSISAEYDRVGMTPEQQIIIMSGLARDPAEAAQVFADLEAEYGDSVFQMIRLELKRQRTKTFGERWWMLVRKVLGEEEPRKYTKRKKPDPKIVTQVRLRR